MCTLQTSYNWSLFNIICRNSILICILIICSILISKDLARAVENYFCRDKCSKFWKKKKWQKWVTGILLTHDWLNKYTRKHIYACTIHTSCLLQNGIKSQKLQLYFSLFLAFRQWRYVLITKSSDCNMLIVTNQQPKVFGCHKVMVYAESPYSQLCVRRHPKPIACRKLYFSLRIDRNLLLDYFPFVLFILVAGSNMVRRQMGKEDWEL